VIELLIKHPKAVLFLIWLLVVCLFAFCVGRRQRLGRQAGYGPAALRRSRPPANAAVANEAIRSPRGARPSPPTGAYPAGTGAGSGGSNAA
jgi:hypothetical protein